MFKAVQKVGKRLQHASTPLGLDKTIENNLKTETNNLSKNYKKFWGEIGIKQSGEFNTITLDHKPIRTPLGNTLNVPLHRPFLGLLLLNEWSNLSNLKIAKHALPLTSIVSRCIDLETNLGVEGKKNDNLNKLGFTERKELYPQLLKYLDTDTLLCFSPAEEYEGLLRKEQNETYLPIISKVEKYLNENFKTPGAEELKLNTLDADLHGLRGNKQSAEAYDVALNFLNSLSIWDLVIFEKTVLSTKSFMCALLLMKPDHFKIPVKDIIRLCTLETVHQTDRWGEVEDTHDVDKRDIARNVNAASIVAYSDKQ